MSRLFILLIATFVLSLKTSFTYASPEPVQKIELDTKERSSLRYHLENTFNEVDLLIRNHKADQADLKRQEKDMAELKVFERIPFQRDLPGLKRELTQTAKTRKIKIQKFQVTHYSQPGQVVPQKTFTHEPLYQLSNDQVAETIFFKLLVTGQEDQIQNWIKSWKTDQMRLVELDLNDRSQLLTKSIRKVKAGTWEIQARSFRYKTLAFPELTPRNPRELLPVWAKKDPDAFSMSEPLLWSYITRIEALSPKARPYYKNRAHFLLNDARMNFFLSKARP